MVVLLGIFKVLSGFELFNWLRKEDLNMTLKKQQKKQQPLYHNPYPEAGDWQPSFYVICKEEEDTLTAVL